MTFKLGASVTRMTARKSSSENRKRSTDKNRHKNKMTSCYKFLARTRESYNLENEIKTFSSPNIIISFSYLSLFYKAAFAAEKKASFIASESGINNSVTVISIN